MELEVLNKKTNENSHINDYKDDVSFEEEISKPDIRVRWSNRLEFVLALIGYTVGIGSILRFPFLCAKNGGGAFLIPYFVFVAICGGPLYYMEMCLGQFSGRSAAKAFEFCPLLRGIGYLMVTISFNVMWYYMNIMAWVLYYFVQSFNPSLSWTTCGNWWNTEHCIETFVKTVQRNSSVYCEGNSTITNSTCQMNSTRYKTAVNEFWEHNVLRISSGIDEVGPIQWHLVLCSFVGWMILVLSLIKGVRSLGKVVYLTALAPYILLTVLFIRGLTLDGSVDGIIWYLTPDFQKIASPQVWIEAAIQVAYTLGPTYGGVITMASHNNFKQNIATDAFICVFTDAFTAFFSGLVVFTCIGFTAKDAGLSVATVAETSGIGLIFVTYPEALSRMPVPQLWSVLFFFTLIMVAFDSAFGMFETVTGAITDTFPEKLSKHSIIVLIVTAGLMFISGLPLSTKAGIYIFTLFDWYVCAFVFMIAASVELILVSWIYGADRFSRDIKMMTGNGVSKLLRILWCLVIPTVLLLGFVVTTFTYTEPKYDENYVFPRSAISIGLFISITPFFPVIGFMVYEIVKAKGPVLKRISNLLKPTKTWLPHDEDARVEYRLKPYIYGDSFLERVRTNLLGNKDTPWF